MTQIAQLDAAVEAYDALAPYYDEFTTGYAHEAWIQAIERRAFDLGLRGRRGLDIACGTGKSTAPLLRRGYSVLGCDVSPGMVREARRKFPAREDSFFVADMRELPAVGSFDLVVCLDDALNYLLSDEELEQTFEGVAAALAPNGVFAFDVNSLLTYRTAFTQTMIRASEGVFFTWQGEETTAPGPGELASAIVEVFAELENGLWERSSSRHVQRHHAPETIEAALGQAGLRCCSVLGQLEGAQLQECADEDRHIKLVYFAKHSASCDPARR
jgi:SAM-dependent methyltransferase